MIYFIGKDKKDCTIEFIYNYLINKTVIGVDIETTRKYKKNKYREDIYKPGLDPYVSKICMLQIGDLDNQFIIDVRYNNIDFLKPILESKTILKVGHNLKFETLFLLCNHDILLNYIWDTMICEKILYNGLKQKYSLEYLMKKYLGYINKEEVSLFNENEEESEYEEYNKYDEVDSIDFKEKLYVDKTIRTQFIEIGDKPFTQEQIKYGAKDIITPLQIYEIQKKGRVVQGSLYLPTMGFQLENSFVQYLAKMSLRGVKVDTEGWKELYKKNKETYVRRKQKLDNWITANYPKYSTNLDLFTNEPICKIDWQSSLHVIKLAKELNFCPKEKSKSTKKFEYTVGAKALFKLLTNENKNNFLKGVETDLIEKDDIQNFILNYLFFKKAQQLTTTFGLDWLRFIHPITGKVHTNFIQLMNTGRMSSTNPNCQQLPNGKEWRKLFITRDSKNKMLATDYKSQEVRVAAEITEVKLMQDLFNVGHPIFKDDVHSLTATSMFRIINNDPEWVCNKEIHSKERGIAKSLLFKILYGGSDFTISQDLGISLQEAKVFYDGFFDGYEGLRKNFEETKSLALQRGWVELDGFTKKRWFFADFERMKELRFLVKDLYPKDWKEYTKEQKEKHYELNPKLKGWQTEYGMMKGKLERSGLNFRIQGLSSSMSKLAAMYIDKDNRSIDYGLLLMVHDEMVEEYPEDIIEERTKITLDSMKKAGTYFCKKVVMEAAEAIGDYWIH